jgi:hypothetical protein
MFPNDKEDSGLELTFFKSGRVLRGLILQTQNLSQYIF